MNDTPTPRTDAKQKLKDIIGDEYVAVDFARQLERELTAAREELAELKEEYGTWWAQKRIAIDELKEVTEQRDRLAEAFQDMLNDTLTPTNDEWIVTDNENYIEIASIKTCDSIASVHGGKTIGDQYDLAGRIARVPQLERELIAARGELAELKEEYGTWWAQKRIAIDELKEVTEQRDRLAEALRQCREDSVELLGERNWWKNEPRLGYQKRYQETRDNVTRADEALQSLNQPTQW